MIFKRIYLFFFTYMAAMYLSQTLLILWLYQNGISFSELIAYYICSFGLAFLGINFLPKKIMNAKNSIFWGIVFSILGVLVLVKIFGHFQLYLSAIFSALNVIFFWIPYNIMHFKFSDENKRGLNSGIYFLITPIIGITLQPLAGIIAEKFGFGVMFFLGILLYIVPLFLMRYLPDFEWSLNVKKELRTLKFNWSTLFQGMSSRFSWTIIGIFTLFFLSTPRQFGNFFGFLAIFAAIASVLNGYVSDHFKNRKIFFYLFSSLAVLSFIPLAFAQNPYIWGLFAGTSSLCIYLANPFWLAFNLDYYKEVGIEKTMILREFFLNFGYVLILILAFIIFELTQSIKITLLVSSLICCFLPIFSYFQKVYLNKSE